LLAIVKLPPSMRAPLVRCHVLVPTPEYAA
jgi:hypothetical protein